MYDDDLTPVILVADNKDLGPLVGYILKAKTTESLSSSANFKKFFPNHKRYSSEIIDEIKRFGENTIINLFNNRGRSYKRIVFDVAERLGVNFDKGKKTTINSIELLILLQILSMAWKNVEKKDRIEFAKNLGILTDIEKDDESVKISNIQTAILESNSLCFNLASAIAESFVNTILGYDISTNKNINLVTLIQKADIKGIISNSNISKNENQQGFNSFNKNFETSFQKNYEQFVKSENTVGLNANSKMLNFIVGIGLVAFGLYAALEVAGPAYRVTIPCVVHIAYLRQKYLLMRCPNCSKPYSEQDNFCSQCGYKLK